MFDLALLIVGFIAAQVVGLVFLVAGLGKLFSGSSAAQSVEAYGLLPGWLARVLGTALPWVELIIAASLLSGFLGSAGAALALALLMVFSLAQTIILIRGQEIPCGCGSLSGRPVRWVNVATNLALAVCCFLVPLASPPQIAFRWIGILLVADRTIFYSPIDVVVFQLITTAVFIEVISFQQLVANSGLRLADERYRRQLTVASAIQRLPEKLFLQEATLQ